ncbi:MAG: TetR/AcrR family transcriptional regulator [Deltaproteobacteria bacterium]|jgi:AcrR family transcriptional regulator|nr:TetR/AcrR family transcriptional regulator [Deltaproteobacteria bacterium]
MKTKTNKTTHRKKILEAAAELFFQQGYRATGINEVIARSGVAKATFYNHFPAKEDLCLAYLQDRNTSEYESIASFVNAHSSPKDRFLAVIESIVPWLEGNGKRGCAFLNMVAEVPDPSNRLRRMGVLHYNMVRDLVHNLAQDLIDSNRESYGSLNADQLADDYMVILVGAIAMVEVYSSTEPTHAAIRMVKRLIE